MTNRTSPAVLRPPRLVIPPPAEAAWGDGMLVLSGCAELVLFADHAAELGTWMTALAERYSLKVTVSVRPAGQGLGWCLVPAGGAVEPAALADGTGYALTVSAAGIACRCGGVDALHHSWLTLMQLIQQLDEGGRVAVAVPFCTIADRPRLAYRMIHLCIFPEMPKDQVRLMVRLIGLLKYSHVVLEFWGTLALETLPELSWPEDWRWSKGEAQELMAMARSFGLEVVPMFNAMGHAAASRIRWGRHVVLDQNPGLAALFEPDGWTWCVSNPRTQDILRGVFDELMVLAGPGAWLHIGCDEAHSFATCDRCRAQDRTALFADHINGLAGHLRGAGRRAIMWGDALLEGGQWPGLTALSHAWLGTHLAIDRLDRSIAIADWHYEITTGPVASLAHFRRHGFDVLAAPWYDHRNISTLARAADQAGALGMMHTTWHRLPQRMEAISNAAMAMWEADPEAAPGRYEKDYAAQLAFLAAHARRLGPTGGSYRTAGWLASEVPVQE